MAVDSSGNVYVADTGNNAIKRISQAIVQAPTYSVTYEANGAGGAPPATASYAAGATVTVADEDGLTNNGYTFGGWEDVSGYVYQAGAGTVTGNGTYPSYAAGSSMQLTATPASGYAFSNWTTPDGNTVTGSVHNFTMPASDINLTANFVAEGSGGSGTVSTPGIAPSSGTVPLQVTISDPDRSVGDSVYYSLAGDPQSVSDAVYLSSLPYSFTLSQAATVYAQAYNTEVALWGSPVSATYTSGGGTTTPVTGVPSTYWGYAAISNLSSKGIISGYPDGTFKPDASITRAEFAAMLVKALGLSTVGTAGTFTDVTANDWCYGVINAARTGFRHGQWPVCAECLDHQGADGRDGPQGPGE